MKGRHSINTDKRPVKYKMVNIVCLCALLIINIVLVLSSGTRSSFSRSFSEGLQVNAGTGKDIISNFDIQPSSGKAMGIMSVSEQEYMVLDPEYIEMEKADGLDYNPVVYFTVEGEAADYVRHINPVVMDSKTKQVPVEAKFDLQSYIQLVNGKDKVDGTIIIRCFLGGFVNETKEIEFTRDYLIKQYCRELGISEGKEDTLPAVITLLAGQKPWEPVVVEPSGNVQMSNEQKIIIDMIVPGLVGGLANQISERDTKISDLTAKVDELNKLISDLQSQTENLNPEIEELKTQTAGSETPTGETEPGIDAPVNETSNSGGQTSGQQESVNSPGVQDSDEGSQTLQPAQGQEQQSDITTVR